MSLMPGINQKLEQLCRSDSYDIEECQILWQLGSFFNLRTGR